MEPGNAEDLDVDGKHGQWLASEQVDSFCISNFQHVGELTTESKIKNAENLIHEKNQTRSEIVAKLEERKLVRDRLATKLKYLPSQQYRQSEILYFQQVLDDRHRMEKNELVIKNAYHQLRHGRNSLIEEKHILEKIKYAKEQIEKLQAEVRVDEWTTWYLQHIRKSKELMINDVMELLSPELERLRREQRAFNSKVEKFKKELEVVEKDMRSMERKLEKINREKGKLYAYILKLKGS